MLPCSLFPGKTDEHGYVYMFVATNFSENHGVNGFLLKPDQVGGGYLREEYIASTTNTSGLNFDYVCLQEDFSEPVVNAENIIYNPFISDTYH